MDILLPKDQKWRAVPDITDQWRQPEDPNTDKKIWESVSQEGGVKLVTKLKLRVQIFLIKCIYQFLKSKESDRVIGKELKDGMLKRIAGLDAAIRVLTDESRR